MMSTHLWVPPICHIHFISILQNPQRFHKASTRLHHFFTAKGLLLLIGFVCQSFAMNSLGGRQQVERHSLTWCILVHLWTSPGVQYKQLFATDSSAGAEVTDNVVLFKSCLLETRTYPSPSEVELKHVWRPTAFQKHRKYWDPIQYRNQFHKGSLLKTTGLGYITVTAYGMVSNQLHDFDGTMYKPSEDEVWSWSRKWEHNMAQEYIHRFIRCISTSYNAFCI